MTPKCFKTYIGKQQKIQKYRNSDLRFKIFRSSSVFPHRVEGCLKTERSWQPTRSVHSKQLTEFNSNYTTIYHKEKAKILCNSHSRKFASIHIHRVFWVSRTKPEQYLVWSTAWDYLSLSYERRCSERLYETVSIPFRIVLNLEEESVQKIGLRFEDLWYMFLYIARFKTWSILCQTAYYEANIIWYQV